LISIITEKFGNSVTYGLITFELRKIYLKYLFIVMKGMITKQQSQIILPRTLYSCAKVEANVLMISTKVVGTN